MFKRFFGIFKEKSSKKNRFILLILMNTNEYRIGLQLLPDIALIRVLPERIVNLSRRMLILRNSPTF